MAEHILAVCRTYSAVVHPFIAANALANSEYATTGSWTPYATSQRLACGVTSPWSSTLVSKYGWNVFSAQSTAGCLRNASALQITASAPWPLAIRSQAWARRDCGAVAPVGV